MAGHRHQDVAPLSQGSGRPKTHTQEIRCSSVLLRPIVSSTLRKWRVAWILRGSQRVKFLEPLWPRFIAWKTFQPNHTFSVTIGLLSESHSIVPHLTCKVPQTILQMNNFINLELQARNQTPSKAVSERQDWLSCSACPAPPIDFTPPSTEGQPFRLIFRRTSAFPASEIFHRIHFFLAPHTVILPHYTRRT
jgi:hypothetical protein